MFNKLKKILLICSLIVLFQTSMLASERPGDGIESQQTKKTLTVEPLDPNFPITKQLDIDASPVVLVNIFKVDQSDVDQLIKAWEEDANWMKKQPGYISTQLHKGIGDSCVFLNYAVWESVKHFKAAFTHPEFRNSLSAYPSSSVTQPHLFSKLSVPNLCTK